MDKFPLCTNEQFVKLNMFPVSNAVRYDIRKCGCINPCLEIAFDVQPDARRIQKPNVTLIEIFPSRPEIEIMKEIRSYTFASLISDIGGALGFYLGACILTCFEIVDCIIRMIIRQLVDKMNRPNQNIPKKIMM